MKTKSKLMPMAVLDRLCAAGWGNIRWVSLPAEVLQAAETGAPIPPPYEIARAPREATVAEMKRTRKEMYRRHRL